MVPAQKDTPLRAGWNARGERAGRVAARRSAERRLLRRVDLIVSSARVSGGREARVCAYRLEAAAGATGSGVAARRVLQNHRSKEFIRLSVPSGGGWRALRHTASQHRRLA